MTYLDQISQSPFFMAVLAATCVIAVILTLGAQLLDNVESKSRFKKVATEREQMRARELARLRAKQGGVGGGGIRGADARSYMKRTVERFSLQKAFVDENTIDKLAQGGKRGQAALTRYLFLRFVSPIAIFLFALFYLLVIIPGGRPPFLNTLYALGIGIVGAYLPQLLLNNSIQKRKQSISKAWPDALDLMLLCVESGMSIEHAIKRVAKEIGLQSPELSEELTLTMAELSFLEDRTRAYDNLSRRTGLDQVRSVATALIQTERYGTSVGGALRVIAEEGRDNRLLEAEKKAASLPPKMTVPLIVFFLPVLFIVVMAPAIISAMAAFS